MDRNIIIAVVVAVVIAALILFVALQVSRPVPKQILIDEHGCVTSNGSTWCESKQKCLTLSEESCPSVIGNATDSHGCLTSTGYTWCDVKQKCLRTWEEPCEQAHIGTALGNAINAKWGFKGVIYPATNEISDEGWLRGSLNVQDTAKYQSICAIFMRGNLTRTLDDGTTLYHHLPITVGNKTICEIAIQGPMTSPCGGFTLHMDIGSMKLGYDKTKDNWQDFFTCAPQVVSDYCKAECSNLMGVLMQDQRRPNINPSTP